MAIKRKYSDITLIFSARLRAVLLLVGLITSGFLIIRPVERNLAFIQAFDLVERDSTNYRHAQARIVPLIIQDCRINWQISLLAIRANSFPESETQLNNMLECSSNSVDWLFLIAPLRADLALRAAQLYPQEPRVWFWLGELARTAKDTTLTDKYFSESVRLDPTFALAWCRLGVVKEKQEQLENAINAFWQCCQNGDPGSNGCNGAGRVAEKLGDIPTAIQYYRRSHWQPALDRADELEASQ